MKNIYVFAITWLHNRLATIIIALGLTASAAVGFLGQAALAKRANTTNNIEIISGSITADNITGGNIIGTNCYGTEGAYSKFWNSVALDTNDYYQYSASPIYAYLINNSQEI